MSGLKVKPTPGPARDAVIGRVCSAYRTSRGAIRLELVPQPVKVIDFYPLTPSQQRKRPANA